MPLEIEIKLKVDSHTPIIATLEKLNAQHLGIARETNIFFDRPDHSLRKADNGLRVRFTTTQINPAPKALLTFKGPKQTTGLHSREPYDLTLTPHDQIIPLLNALGFIQTLRFEKDRDSWFLNDCHIELDTLPHFGTFLEIEGPSESAVQSVQSQLHLTDIPQHKKSYSHMISEFTKDLRF